MPVPTIRKKRAYSGIDLAVSDAQSATPESTTEHVNSAQVIENEWQVIANQNGINSEAATYVGAFSQYALTESKTPQHWDITGLDPDQQTIIISGTTKNATTPRDIGGIAGHQRLNRSIGPVTGAASEWTGNNNQDSIPVDYVGAQGPVGYLDYSSALAQAHAAANRNVYDQAIAEAQLIASQ